MMSESKRQGPESEEQDSQAWRLWVEASIDALAQAIERLDQSVNNQGVSRPNPTFDSMFIRGQLDNIKRGYPKG
jgi:hypothetical protein